MDSETKIIYRQSIREAYKRIFGRKISLELENQYLQEIIEYEETQEQEAPKEARVLN